MLYVETIITCKSEILKVYREYFRTHRGYIRGIKFQVSWLTFLDSIEKPLVSACETLLRPESRERFKKVTCGERRANSKERGKEERA